MYHTYRGRNIKGLTLSFHLIRSVGLNEEAGYKREGNSPNFRDFLRLATATNIVLPLYKPKNSLNFFYNT